MRQSQEQQDPYYQLLDCLKVLFKRENLCHNTYLFRQMHKSLTVPLYIIAEEKTVAQISRDYELIIDALQDTGLAHVVGGKQVTIIEHPTIKINTKDHDLLRQIQQILEQKDIKYEISKRYDQDHYINLTVFSEGLAWLEGLIKKIGKQIDFEKASLMEDISFGVQRIRKLKFDHAKQKTALGKTKYSLQHPPQLFVRKALESSDQEHADFEAGQKQTNRRGKNGKTNGFNHKQKNYKGKAPIKPQIEQQDFPQLNG